MTEYIEKLKNLYKDISISKKIYSVNFALIIVPIILLVLITTFISSNILISGTKNSSIQNLKLVSQNLENLISTTEKTANIIIPYPEIQKFTNISKFDDELYKYEQESFLSTIIDNIITHGDKVSTATIMGRNGLKVLSGATVKTEFNKTIISEDYIKHGEIMKDVNSKWYGLHSYNYNEMSKHGNAISYKKNIRNGDTGERRAVLVLNVDEETIAKSYLNIDYGKNGKLFILNKYGDITSAGDKSKLYRNISSEKYVKWILNNNMAGKIFRLEGKRHLVTVVKFDKFNWSIVGLIPLKDLLANQKIITYLILIIGIALVFIAQKVMRLTSQTISKPIVDLCETMEQVGKGEFELELSKIGNDEIGQLTESFNKMTREISELLEINFQQNKKQRELEFIAIQAQINPHFLYNTLESICSLILLGEKDEAYKMTNSLSTYYRTSLSKGRKIITIEEEMLNIISYLTIQKIRYGNKFEYEIDIPNEIKKKSIIKLSIQPLVENAIYHGIKLKNGKGRIIIQGKVKEDDICISVIDDGVGMPENAMNFILKTPESEDNQKSFGVKSVDERIKLVFGDQYGLKIESELDLGTKIDIYLPKESKKGNDIYD